jgi:hypothetical protein
LAPHASPAKDPVRPSERICHGILAGAARGSRASKKGEGRQDLLSWLPCWGGKVLPGFLSFDAEADEIECTASCYGGEAMAKIVNVEIRYGKTLIAKAPSAEINTPADAHKLTVSGTKWETDFLPYLQKNCEITGRYPPNKSAFKATMKLAGVKGGRTAQFD